MKRVLLAFLALQMGMQSFAQNVSYKFQPETGAIQELRIDGDATGMDWIMKTDATQYPWVTEKYGWGLGYLTVNGERKEWQRPAGC